MELLTVYAFVAVPKDNKKDYWDRFAVFEEGMARSMVSLKKELCQPR